MRAGQIVSALYLAADIGGTNCRVALAEMDSGRWRIRYRGAYPSQNYPSAEWILRDFLGACDSPVLTAAGIAVAGPIANGRAQLTNVSWHVDAAQLSAAFGLPVVLLNDFEAVAHGLPALASEDLVTLQPGIPERGAPKLLVGAGTGLGVGVLAPSGDRYQPLRSEGGHADFAPQSAIEVALMRHLADRYGHVSWERIVSGPGLEAIYGFLLAQAKQTSQPLIAAEITEAALAGTDPLAVQTLEMFVSAYGAFTGNLALTVLPQGGVYLAGGIAPRMLAKLDGGSFLHAFTAKGRFSALLAEMPVRVVTNGDVGLLGALEVARDCSGAS